MEARLGEAELRFAKAKSLNLARAYEIIDLRAALDACKKKWYDEGFADAKNSMELIILQALAQGFEKGWLATFQATGVLGSHNCGIRNRSLALPSLSWYRAKLKLSMIRIPPV